MGSAISFRLNPKNESDKKILDWLEEKSSQPGFLNQTEAIKKAILTAIEDEKNKKREKSIEDWISEAILLSREEFIKIVQESSQNVANNMFAGVLGVMAQQMNMGAVPVMPVHMTGTVPNSMSGNMQNTIFNTTQGNESINVTEEAEVSSNELEADISAEMDNSTKKEARRIEEEEARLKAEALAREETARKEKQLHEERKQRELLSQKRKLAFSRNSIQQDYCIKELAREDWNKDYVDYLRSQFINVNDADGFTEKELSAPILTRDEFERQQALELYHEKADRAGELWDMVLNQLSSSAHQWKWDYMDYLEDIRYKEISDATLGAAKEEILSYEEFAELMNTEKEKQAQKSRMYDVSADTIDEAQDVVVSEEVDAEIVEMEETVSEVVADVAEVIDLYEPVKKFL